MLVSTQAFGVRRRTTHHLTPPGDDIAAVLITHRAAEECCEQFVVLDEVVEPTQPAFEGRSTAGPLIDRRYLATHLTSHRLLLAQ